MNGINEGAFGQQITGEPLAPPTHYRSLCPCGITGTIPDRQGCCLTVSNIPIRRPDLAIYSQEEALALGEPPTWDNISISTNEWPDFHLLPEARVTVRNRSTTTAAIGGLVRFYTSPFGIGTPRTLRSTQLVNVGPGQRAELRFPLDRADFAGDSRAGVHIEIEHPHDSEPLNNIGSQVVDGAPTSVSGRDFQVRIPVVNDSPESRQIDLSIMWTEMIASVTPLNHMFGPFEHLLATLHIRVPDFMHGTSDNPKPGEVTVVARGATGELIGGATSLVRIDD